LITFLLLLGLAGIGGWMFWRSWGRPLLDLRDLIRALANDEPHHPIVRSSLRPFQQISADLGRVADRLRRQRRQIADEGFSLRAILGSMVEGVIIVDHSQRIRLANDALYTMFELTTPPINRTVLEVFHHPELTSAIERSFTEIRSIIIEIHDAPRFGESRDDRHYRVNLAPLMPTNGSKPVGVLGVFNDVTEVRALEAVRREFVANVSHEFRTPLAIIGGYVETLLDGALDDRPMAERSLQTIQKHSERLNLLIEDLLSISRLEHRKVQLDCRATSIRGILDRVIDQLEPRIRERNASIEIALDVDEVEMDPARIEQVFFNLLANALQYGVPDGVFVRVSSRLRGDEVEITFSDNGPGIPYRDQPHIFERFYRVHKDRSRDAGGTGLGLSIVKNVAMAHGGRVSVRSTPGAGASFRIVLPVRQSAG
jgi:two-component system phosphate regulon sensor histidine kinase PhoR